MKILLLAHSFNSLTQRLWVELERCGHEVTLELDVRDSVAEEAIALAAPDLIVAPFLKRAISETIWRRHRCIVIHPGIVGDRGPSALDWAILNDEPTWGVTALQANGEMDAGDVWASVEFPMRAASKGSLYRNEVTDAAVEALRMTLARIARGDAPVPLAKVADVRGQWRPFMRQDDRSIDWRNATTADVLRRIRSADGVPGVADSVLGLPVYLFDAHAEERLRGPAGAVVAQRDGAICRATADGAVWITQLKPRDDAAMPFKRPAAQVLGTRLADVPEAPLAIDAKDGGATWREIRYEEFGAVGVLHFAFYNGAMSTAQCERLLAALRLARSRPTQIIVLAGGPDFWSNGIHLNVIEASPQPAQESLRNIEAIDDVAREILLTDRQWTIAALQGNAGAGGVFLALAADQVVARDGLVLNPHYKAMGNLFGSEYWTYTLPRRVGQAKAAALTGNRLPIGAAEAMAIGLVDAILPRDGFLPAVIDSARQLAAGPGLAGRIAERNARRQADWASKPLDAYRAEELAKMHVNFFGFDPSYHVARSNFVRKVAKARTPLYLARHRRGGTPSHQAERLTLIKRGLERIAQDPVQATSPRQPATPARR